VFGKQKPKDSSNETRKGGDEDPGTSDVAQNATSDVQKTPHQTWPELPPQTWRNEPHNNKQSGIYNKNNVNVNGDKEKGSGNWEEGPKTDLRKLPDLEQDKAITESIAQDLVNIEFRINNGYSSISPPRQIRGIDTRP
jgi:hypothetical protein